MKIKRWTYLLIGLLILGFGGLWTFKKFNFNTDFSDGQKIDSLNGVYVYYNGGVDNVTDRNTTADGYNLGLKYQCVEFVLESFDEYRLMYSVQVDWRTYYGALIRDNSNKIIPLKDAYEIENPKLKNNISHIDEIKQN